jgi:hypothetical protein
MRRNALARADLPCYTGLRTSPHSALMGRMESFVSTLDRWWAALNETLRAPAILNQPAAYDLAPLVKSVSSKEASMRTFTSVFSALIAAGVISAALPASATPPSASIHVPLNGEPIAPFSLSKAARAHASRRPPSQESVLWNFGAPPRQRVPSRSFERDESGRRASS